MPHFTISTDPSRLDCPWICKTLKDSYWGAWLTDGQILKSLDNSLCFGVYEVDGDTWTQVGFARVLTDHACLSSVTDVVIDTDCRGVGLGRKLLEAVVAHEWVRPTICVLQTRTAHAFYVKFGFARSDGIMARMPQ